MADLKSIERVLVANRGEIARRVMRTCHEMGISTVAVFSDADEDALHVRDADLAVRIGPAPSSESYLCIDKLIDAAQIPRQQANKGFRLTFSASPFPGFQDKIVWRREQFAGNWYYSPKYDMEGWLCPALFKYFKRAPNAIYVKAEAIPHSS